MDYFNKMTSTIKKKSILKHLSRKEEEKKNQIGNNSTVNLMLSPYEFI